MAIYDKSFHDECNAFGNHAASTCRVDGPEGNKPVDDPRARALLKRAFAYMYSDGEEPHAVQISIADFRRFPNVQPHGNPKCAWLGVKIRGDRCPVFIALAREDMPPEDKVQSISRTLRELNHLHSE